MAVGVAYGQMRSNLQARRGELNSNKSTLRIQIPAAWLFLILCWGVLSLGCQSTRRTQQIQHSLQKQASEEEARRGVLAAFDRDLSKIHSDQNSNEPESLHQILMSERSRQNAKLDSFFARFRPGDECWIYRTYATTTAVAAAAAAAAAPAERYEPSALPIKGLKLRE